MRVASLLIVLACCCLAQGTTLIAFQNAYAGGPAVDLLEDGVALFTGVRYDQAIIPLYREPTFSSGRVTYSLRISGTSSIIATKEFILATGKQYTVFVTGRTDANFAPELFIQEDNQVNECPIPEDSSRFRLCHAAPGSGTVDLIDTNTNILYAVDVSLTTCSDFFYLPTGSYSFQVIQSSIPNADPQQLLTFTSVTSVDSHQVYSLWLIGVRTEALTPLKLDVIPFIPCGAPVPFEVVPVARPDPVNPIVLAQDDEDEGKFNGQPIVYSDGVATLTVPTEEYVGEFVFPPPRSPMFKNGGSLLSASLSLGVVLLVLSIII